MRRVTSSQPTPDVWRRRLRHLGVRDPAPRGQFVGTARSFEGSSVASRVDAEHSLRRIERGCCVIVVERLLEAHHEQHDHDDE